MSLLTRTGMDIMTSAKTYVYAAASAIPAMVPHSELIAAAFGLAVINEGRAYIDKNFRRDSVNKFGDPIRVPTLPAQNLLLGTTRGDHLRQAFWAGAVCTAAMAVLTHAEIEDVPMSNANKWEISIKAGGMKTFDAGANVYHSIAGFGKTLSGPASLVVDSVEAGFNTDLTADTGEFSRSLQVVEYHLGDKLSDKFSFEKNFGPGV